MGINAPDRYERFVVPEGLQKYDAFFLPDIMADAVVDYFPCVFTLLLWLHPCASVCSIGRRISIEKDTKVTNAATFTLQREDHTVGNLVRM